MPVGENMGIARFEAELPEAAQWCRPPISINQPVLYRRPSAQDLSWAFTAVTKLSELMRRTVLPLMSPEAREMAARCTGQMELLPPMSTFPYCQATAARVIGSAVLSSAFMVMRAVAPDSGVSPRSQHRDMGHQAV